MENKETVCAVVVTYNRKELLLECLASLLDQTKPLDAIYLIDNASTDGTPEVLLDNGYLSKIPDKVIDVPWELTIDNNKKSIKIHYVRMHKNTGGAGGFYEGIKRAHQNGYNWLWIMDDDAEPHSDSMEILAKYFQDDSIVALANSVIKPNGEIALMHRGKTNFDNMFPAIQKPIPLEDYNKESVEIDTASFVGLLVRSSAVNKIGYPMKEFFIHNDDIEYCLRLMTVGKIILIPDSKINHKEASHSISRRIPYDKLWLSYYGQRNLIVLANKYSTNKIKFYLKLIIEIIKNIIGIILFDKNHKINRILFVISSNYDGLKENFDNNKAKKILYK